MKTTQFALSAIALFILVSLSACNSNKESSPAAIPAVSDETLEDEVWQMEELYWKYVKDADTVAYKKLWHENFIGYPSFGDGTANKSRIAVWIPELHADKNLTFSYVLYKKEVNAIEGVVMAFYDTDEIWTNQKNEEVRRERSKFTHTWKKLGDTWLILGGMAAPKKME
jgi:hypothetical protein